MENRANPVPLSALVTSLLWVGACGQAPTLDLDPIDGVSRSFSATVRVSEHEEEALLGFLNHPSTDLALLDSAVALNQRAAAAIIEHRNGSDGQFLSADDDPFDSLEELDGVAFVGPVALRRIRSYVATHPGPFGEWVEGVEFSGVEALAVVWGVNHSTLALLDHTVGLSSRAASQLLLGVPYSSVAEMALVPWVGPAALVQLRGYAQAWDSQRHDLEMGALAGRYDGVFFDADTARRALDIARGATQEELVSLGMWATGARRLLRGRPFRSLRQVSDTDGVGAATMGQLHRIAAEALWPLATCPLVFNETSQAAVDAYGRLLSAIDPQAGDDGFALAIYSAPDCLRSGLSVHDQVLESWLLLHLGVSSPGIMEQGSAMLPSELGVEAFLAELRRSRNALLATHPGSRAAIETLHAQVAALAMRHPENTVTLRASRNIDDGVHRGLLWWDRESALVMVMAAERGRL